MLSNCGAGEDLRVLWTARRSNHSILKGINSEYSLEGLMLKLKLQFDVKSPFIGKDPDTGKIDGKRRRGWKRVRWLVSITDLMDMNLSKLQEMVKNSETSRAAVHGVAKNQTWPSDWTTTSFLLWQHNHDICISTPVLTVSPVYFFIYEEKWVKSTRFDWGCISLSL